MSTPTPLEEDSEMGPPAPLAAPGPSSPQSSLSSIAESAANAAAARVNASLSPTRPPYIPQFTAATQMILKRMKGESTSLSSALANTRTPINPTAYEDARRRIIAGMNTTMGMTMQMPAPPPPAILSTPSAARPSQPRSTAGMSAIRKVTAGLTGRGRAKPAVTTAAGLLAPPAPITKKQGKSPSAGTPSKAGTKRKRSGGNKADDASSLTSLSESEGDRAASSAPPTTTKSGRQVLKPATYNPAAMDSITKKRAHAGKRTTEQALCKKCTRLVSPESNQIVFCDGCEGAWHQLCHDPEIDDSVIANPTVKWFCAGCVAKRERQVVNKRVKVEGTGRVSWMGRTPGQKRAYLSGLSQTELINLVIYCTELHPDLPIFPADESMAQGSGMPRSLFAGSTTDGLFTRAEANPHGPVNFIRKVSTNGKGSSPSVKATSVSNGAQKVIGTPFDPDEEDPTGLVEAWPKAGHGLYAKLPSEWEDDALVDRDDFEAFSHIVYDDKGRKVEENGIAVSSR